MTSCWPSGPPAIGTTAELSRTIGPDDIDRFTDISGDRNPLHYDLAAARASRFGEIVVQGGITSAILNAVVAERLPGPGTVFLNVNWDFKAPVRPGDVITGRVEVIEARTDKPVTKLRTTVTRGDGTVALDGTAVCYTMAITAERQSAGVRARTMPVMTSTASRVAQAMLGAQGVPGPERDGMADDGADPAPWAASSRRTAP